MRIARFVRTLALLLGLSLAGSGAGCGPGSLAPMEQKRQDQIKESKKTAHQQIKEDARKAQLEAKQQGSTRRSAPSGR